MFQYGGRNMAQQTTIQETPFNAEINIPSRPQRVLYKAAPYTDISTHYNRDSKKHYICRFEECGKGYSSEDTRRRHYRKHHASQWSTVRRCKENTVVKKENERKQMQLDRALSTPHSSSQPRPLLPRQAPIAQPYRQHSLPQLSTSYSANSLPQESPRSVSSMTPSISHPMLSAPHSSSSDTSMPKTLSSRSIILNTEDAARTLGHMLPIPSVPSIVPEPDPLLLELQRLVDSYAK